MRNLPVLRLLLLALFPPQLLAQAPVKGDSTIALPGLTVTASRVSDSAATVAGSVAIVARATIEGRQATTADQVLRELPGVSVVGDGAYGEEVRVNLRGFNSGYSTQRALVLLDGRPLTDEYLGHTDLVQYPLDAVERIEVVRGGISAAWGTSALGGVINLRPRQGGDVPRATIDVTGGTHGTYSGTLGYGRRIGTADVFATAGASTTDGYRRTDSGLPIDWQSQHGLLNLGVPIGGAVLRSITNVYHGDGNDDQFHRGLTRIAEDLGLHLFGGGASPSETQFRLYIDHLDQDLAWYQAPNVSYLQTGIGGYASHSFNLGERQRILAGLDFRHNQADVTEFAGEVDRDETIAALFVQDEIQLGRWALLLGLRGDRGGQGETALSYRGGVRYDVSDRTTLRAGVARAFRAPTLSDRYLPPTPFGPVTFVGNPDLKPETAISAEIGWLQRIGSGLHLEVTAYAIRSDGFWDFIADTGSLFKAQNITRVPIYGLEATLSARLTSRFDARLGYTYNDAKYSEFIGDPSVEGNYVDDNVLHSGSASLSWAAARGVDFWLSGQFVGRRYTDPENTEAGRLKPYQLVGAGVSVRIAEPITLRLKADNLFDQHYQTRPEFYQAGLTFTVGLQASF